MAEDDFGFDLPEFDMDFGMDIDVDLDFGPDMNLSKKKTHRISSKMRSKFFLKN